MHIAEGAVTIGHSRMDDRAQESDEGIIHSAGLITWPAQCCYQFSYQRIYPAGCR
jgi:hypothetical protein